MTAVVVVLELALLQVASVTERKIETMHGKEITKDRMPQKQERTRIKAKQRLTWC